MVAAAKRLKIFLIVLAVLVLLLGVSLGLLVKYANKIAKSELERMLGKAFSVDRIDLKWGQVEASGIKLKNETGKETIRVGSLGLKADFVGLLRKQYIISSITVRDPYLFVEIDNKGNIVNPVLPLEAKPGEPAEEKQPEKSSPPITVKKIKVTNGSVDYLDRKTPVTPVLTKVRNIDLTMEDVSIPLADTFLKYALSANIPGNQSTGVVKSNGKIRIKTKDMDLKANLRKLDITALKPYFQKDSPVNITKGFLDLDMDVKVLSQKLHAPGTVVLKELEFQSGPGMGGRFMGVPLALVVSLLKKSNDEIPVNFVLEGDLNNPKFDVKENFMERISVAMAGKLGLPIKGITEAVTGIGGKGAKEVGSSVKEIGESLKKLFK